jgi:hypothetical protein
MERKMTYWGLGAFAAILLLTLGAVYQGSPVIGHAESQASRTCPHLLQLGPQCQVEIVRMSFTDRVESLLYLHEIPDAAREQYRFAVVTLKITKPAGVSLSLAAADLTLHYYHGDETEVAPCEGLSWFKRDSDARAPILMNPVPGPGFIKQTTSPDGTAGTTVFIDAIFGFMEPDTRECWVCFGQPAVTAPFTCPAPAWGNESRESKTPKAPPALQAPPA